MMTEEELKETYKNKWIKTEWRLLDGTLMDTTYFYVLDVNKYEEPGDYYVFHGHRYLTSERDNKSCPIYAKYENIAVTLDRIMIVDETEVIQRLSDDKAKINTYMEKITDDILSPDDVIEPQKEYIKSLEKELEKYKNMSSQEAYDLFIDKWCKELKND